MPAKTDKRQKRRAGFYWEIENGIEVPYVSVTTVLKVVDKPALQFWFGREVYLAMAKDPSMSQRAALAAPYRASKKSMDRGSAIHKIAENWDHTNTKVDVSALPLAYQGYGKALQSWSQTVKPVPIENELTVISKQHGYAGTLDQLATINGEEAIIDFKTNKKGAVYDEAHVQLAAYQQALKEMGRDIKKAYVVGLSETGKFNMVEADLEFKAFLAAKILWEFKNREMLTKMGYTNLLIKK